MDEQVIIKKYSNRRLYNTEQSEYITLDQVAELIKSGREVKVVEASSGQDVTGFILTQIIMESSRKQALLPVSLLHLLIRYGDNLLSDFFEQYLEETLKIYIDSKKAFDSYFRQWLNMGMQFTGNQPHSTDTANPFSGMFKMFGMPPEHGGDSDKDTKYEEQKPGSEKGGSQGRGEKSGKKRS